MVRPFLLKFTLKVFLFRLSKSSVAYNFIKVHALASTPREKSTDEPWNARFTFMIISSLDDYVDAGTSRVIVTGIIRARDKKKVFLC